MKHALILLVLAIISSCTGDGKVRDYFFPEVGWTVTVPEYFEIMDKNLFEMWNEDARNAHSENNVGIENYDQTKPLLLLIRGASGNSLVSFVRPYSSLETGDYGAAHAFANSEMIKGVSSQYPGTEVDTMSGREVISGLEFQTFYFKAKNPNGSVTNCHMYYRLRRGLDFQINLTYGETDVGERLKKVLASSKFQ